MTIINDPNADARSLMNRAPCVCDGEASGVACKHFWPVIQKFRAANADALRSGDKRRNCTMAESFLLEWTSEEKPTFCGRYEPRPEPGLVNIVKRAVTHALGIAPQPGAAGALTKVSALGAAGWVPFFKEFDDFNPLTLEEITKLREEFPDRPVQAQFGGFGLGGKNPMSMSVKDIIEGEQIGIVKPGEAPPTTGLSEETEKALDGIFSTTSGISKKEE